MKLPSFDQIVTEAGIALRRFPAVMACALIATMTALILIEKGEETAFPLLYPVLWTAILGMPMLVALALTSERHALSMRHSMLLHAPGILLLIVYAMSLPGNLPLAPEMHHVRLFMLVIAAGLLVPVLPWLRDRGSEGFWSFGRALVLRLLQTGLFTGVLFAGLAIALAALDNLFGVSVPAKRYGELGVLLAGMFAPWFMLAGMPRDFSSLEHEAVLSKGIRIFTQYILLPIAVIYLVILYAYMGRVIIAWEWPNGWVTGLVIGFLVVSHTVRLLLHPLRNQGGNAWLMRMMTWQHVLTAPLVVLMTLALLYRIDHYGITEGRYLAFALGAWSMAMLIHGLWRRDARAQTVPLALCIAIFAVSYGPWSAFSISERSQVARLEFLLQQNGMLAGGRVQKASGASTEAVREISSILWYLQATHGYTGIQAWFDSALTEDRNGLAQALPPETVATMLGVEYTTAWMRAGGDNTRFERARDAALTVSGWERLSAPLTFSRHERQRVVECGGLTMSASDDLTALTLRLTTPDGAVDTIMVDMGRMVTMVAERWSGRDVTAIPPDSLCADAHGRWCDVRIFAPSIGVKREEGRVTPEWYTIAALVRTTQP